MHYQVQVEATFGLASGFEALPRWNHPQIGDEVQGFLFGRPKPLAEIMGSGVPNAGSPQLR